MDTAEKCTLDFKITDATSYDAHVGDFERFSAVLTTPLATRIIAMADISAGQRVLDIGTGTGVVALEAAKAAGDRGRCIAIDLSEKMLVSARANARRAKLIERIEFRTMDAESLQFEAASFDVVVSLFALLHFPHPDVALKEMFRVLRPSGTLVVGVGSAPRWLSAQGIGHAVSIVQDVIARLRGRQLVAPQFLNQLVQECIPAHDEPEESSLAQAGRNRTRNVPQLLRDAGFENLRQHWEAHRATLETLADFWDIQRTFSTIARKRLNTATSDQIAEIRAKFEEVCQDVLSRDGRLTYPFAAFFVAARRPLQS
ncbi:MAG TPA: methyltransferase domain-containing protein [Chthoniobacterales bacterium]|nr:methyltransferase domain-containing protein [Chthoniobacterales bacterium]